MRVDRLDPSKNVVRGFLAYEAMLRRWPELIGRVIFVAFLIPSRQSVGIYRSYEREVRRLRFGASTPSLAHLGGGRW